MSMHQMYRCVQYCNMCPKCADVHTGHVAGVYIYSQGLAHMALTSRGIFFDETMLTKDMNLICVKFDDRLAVTRCSHEDETVVSFLLRLHFQSTIRGDILVEECQSLLHSLDQRLDVMLYF